MPDLITCPHCSQPVEAGENRCPACEKDIGPPLGDQEGLEAVVSAVSTEKDEAKLDQVDTETPPGEQVAPEILVPRLGDYLLESGFIQPEGLDRALEYQEAQAALGRRCLLGQALLDLGLVDRDTLDQAITGQLQSFHSALQDANRQLEQRVQQRTQDLEKRLVQIRTAAEVTQLAISASSLNDLLQRTVNLIAERFGYDNAAIFLVDDSQKQAVLSASSGLMQMPPRGKPLELEIGSKSMIGWAATYNQPRVASDVSEDHFYRKHEQLPDTRSEVAIPFAIGREVLGVLDVQHSVVNAFDPDAVAVLQTIANHIASVVQNFRLLETTQASLADISTLYQASHQMTQAETVENVFEIATSVLQRSPFNSIFLIAELDTLRVAKIQQPELASYGLVSKPITYPDEFIISSSELDELIAYCVPFAIIDSLPDVDQVRGLPDAVLSIPRQMECKSVALIPSIRAERLEALLILGSLREGALTANVLWSYAGLADLITTALGKVYALQRMEKRLAALQTLNAISQAISVQTDLMALYEVIHNEVSQIMGDVNFAIATYDDEMDMIQVPYMYDRVEVRSVDPFPLGEGLTSILVRTRKPLLLVRDTERKSRELGAKLVGAPAKSWLGVPLLVAGEVLGAILVQDLEHEGRFDEDDQRLLETLASQVAVAIRNARLLEGTHRQAERERLLYDITSKIRSSPDMKTILATTTRELSRALGAQRAVIEIGADVDREPHAPDIEPESGAVAPEEEAEETPSSGASP